MRADPYSGSYDFSNPQSFNKYAYVMNNPLSLVDPLGLQSCDGGGGGDGPSDGNGTDNGGDDPADPMEPESVHARHQFSNGCLSPPPPPPPPVDPCILPGACNNAPTPHPGSGSGGTGRPQIKVREVDMNRSSV